MRRRRRLSKTPQEEQFKSVGKFLNCLAIKRVGEGDPIPDSLKNNAKGFSIRTGIFQVLVKRGAASGPDVRQGSAALSFRAHSIRRSLTDLGSKAKNERGFF